MSKTDTSALLPGEPAPVDLKQKKLTSKHLAPKRAALEAALVALRAEVDRDLAPQYPHFAGKPYPMGRCLEIRDALFDRLKTALAADSLPGLRHFVADGGIARKIWGDLRGAYFQNALQFGAWYVDVGNDTVDPTKPPIEILPLKSSGFVTIRDYRHWCRIAAPYWQAELYANTVFPKLAPYVPVICAAANGAVWLASANDEMIEATRRDGFRPSEAILQDLPRPSDAVAAKLLSRVTSDNTLLDTMGNPLEICATYRETGIHRSDTQRDLHVAALISL